jgi:prepilin-type N-terminal cleavage/methylation domain-containing protein
MTTTPSRGFTLIETVIVVGLFALLSLILALLFLYFNTTYIFGTARIDTAGSARNVITAAEELLLPARYTLASRTFSGTPYIADSTTLILEIPSYAAGGAVIANTYDYAVIYKTGSSVYVLIEANPASERESGTKLLSEYVSALEFTYDNMDYAQVTNVAVNITTASVVKGTTVTAELQEKVYLRNHP